MCDIVLAPPDSTAGRVMLFGKNSDRQRNEAQAVEYFPRTRHAADAALTCTYITIPQVQQTNAVLLCRPFWIWGAEMGANEHGLVVGNEGLHARGPPPETEALTGMDLLRLALERASSAVAAVEVITTLLERFGQGGNCGHLAPAYYNNGFMVSDPDEAFVLETVGREWLVERVRGVRAISNGYSIGHEAQQISAGLPTLISNSGWSAEGTVNYAEAIASPHREHIGNAGARRARSISLLSSCEGRLTVADVARILRDHGCGDGHQPGWRAEVVTRRTLCMHAGAEDRAGQTVGSIISELGRKDAVHWVTGTSAPCSSIFKPVLLGVPLPTQGGQLTGHFDSGTVWWRHERLHRRAILGDFEKFIEEVGPERDALEADFQARVKTVLDGGSHAERSQVITACWKEAVEAEDRWANRMPGQASVQETPYVSAWTKMNQLAGVELSDWGG